jgi:hypothetical protein
VTLAQACRVAGVSLPDLLAALNAELTRGRPGARSLPVVEVAPPAPADHAQRGCSCCEERHPTAPAAP